MPDSRPQHKFISKAITIGIMGGLVTYYASNPFTRYGGLIIQASTYVG